MTIMHNNLSLAVPTQFKIREFCCFHMSFLMAACTLDLPEDARVLLNRHCLHTFQFHVENCR